MSRLSFVTTSIGMWRRKTNEFELLFSRERCCCRRLHTRISDFLVRTSIRAGRIRDMLSTYDPTITNLKLAFLKKRSKVVDVCSADGVVFALTETGICVAFCADSGRRMTVLNTHPLECIRSLFFNDSCHSMITVSSYRRDYYTSLKCRSTKITDVLEGNPEDGVDILDNEHISYPGFVEFDDMNRKIISFSPTTKEYTVWDMRTYEKLYSINGESISEIRTCQGKILAVGKPRGERRILGLQLFRIDDGKVEKKWKQRFSRSRNVQFIETYDGKLIVKQEQDDLKIYDINKGGARMRTIRNTHMFEPEAFIFLFKSKVFLTFDVFCLTLWSLEGERLKRMDSIAALPRVECANSIYVTSQQDILLVFCRERSSNQRSLLNCSYLRDNNSRIAYICVLDVRNGEQISCITSEVLGNSIEELTALSFDEVNGDLLVGNVKGDVIILSS